MQTILGANGVIGVELAKCLPRFTDRVRLVSRNPKKVNDQDEIFPADLLDAKLTQQAVQGSEVVYLTVGLPYSLKVWQNQWPAIMDNVIDACKKACKKACKRNGAKLVFFDNVYLYGKVDGWMTEETPVNPISKKGQVRAAIAERLMTEVRAGGLKAIIARSADFYGPRALSVANIMVFDNFKKGKKAQWVANDRVKHSFTYTPDAGRAMALLGNTESAYNQVWHLPTDRNALTGKEFIERAANALGVEPRYSVLPKWMIKAAGLFNPLIRENVEMLYQNDPDYLFDSSKFDRTFEFETTPYEPGIRESLESTA